MARNKYDIDEELQEGFNISHVKRALGYLTEFKWLMILIIALTMFASFLGMLGPYLFKEAIDKGLPGEINPQGSVEVLLYIGAIYLATIILSSVLTGMRVKSMADIGQRIVYNIRLDLFTHLQKLPFAYYDSRPHGKILVRVVNYVNSLSDILSNGIVTFFTDIFSIITTLIIMFMMNVRLAVISLIGLPLIFIVIFTIKNAQRKAWQDVSRKQSNINAYLHESINGIKVTQSFTREQFNKGIFERLNNLLVDSWMRAQRISQIIFPSFEIIYIIGASLMYFVGVGWLENAVPGITVGVLVAFATYSRNLWTPIQNLSNFYNQLQITAAYLERIFETMDEDPVVEDLKEASILPDIQGRVEFKDVVFSYDNSRIILNSMSFTAHPGETIALVGPTGSGKTTVVNLLSRFYNLNSGEILIDGHNISLVTLDSLRRQMGIMLQDAFIFSGNIMDNIRYGRLDATDEEVIEAAKVVRADDFIRHMPEGYMTQVNERGSRLSSGQRQLISFARVLLADPKILVLDEATSSIDTKTEKLVQEGLMQLLKGRTSFIIAHRLSTIRNAHRIMYIKNGIITEQGSHADLMTEKGLYWELYTAQYRMLTKEGGVKVGTQQVGSQ